MCESKRKYQYYEIEVVFANGDKEKIDMLHSTPVDKSNFKEMRRVYNEIKEQYKDKQCVINFCGSSDDSSMNVIFYKEIRVENGSQDDIEIITNDKPINQCLKELTTIINSINEREKYLDNKYNLLAKEQDFLLHKIELSEENVSLDEIVKTYKDIKRIRIDRRNVKNEKIILENVKNTNFKDNLGKVLNAVNALHIDKREERLKEIKAEAKDIYSAPLEENELIKTLVFRTHKERISLMSQLQPKYDRVIVDDKKRTITCYNKCKGR